MEDVGWLEAQDWLGFHAKMCKQLVVAGQLGDISKLLAAAIAMREAEAKRRKEL